MKNGNDDRDDPAKPTGLAISGTQGFVIGAVAAAALIVLGMAVLNLGFFEPSEATQPFTLQSSPSAAE